MISCAKSLRQGGSMARKIVITSGKGGVGKTTIAVKLAKALAQKGQRVILFDGDFGLNNADLILGLENFVTYDIIDVIEGRCRAKQALIRHPKYPNLFLLTSGRVSPERYISPQAIRVVLDALSPQFDFIFIDCPTGVEEGFHRAVATADEAIVVTTLQTASLRDADKVIGVLNGYRLSESYLVINKVRGERIASGECLTPIEVAELLRLPLLGVLPLWEGGMENPFAVRILATNLWQGERKIYDTAGKYEGFFGNIRRALKKRL